MSTVKEEAIKLRQNIDAVYEAGKKAEHNRFWDFWQNNGKRRVYDYAFYGLDLKDFYPKHDLVLQQANWFMRDAVCSTGKLDLAERLKECGVTLDTSTATDLAYFLYQAEISRVPQLDFRNKPTGTVYVMFGGHIEVIDKIMLPADGMHLYGVFRYCTALREVQIEGQINPHANGIAFQLGDSPNLSHDTIMSFVNALADMSGDTSDTQFVAKFGSTNLAKLTEDEKAIMDAKGWIYV